MTVVDQLEALVAHYATTRVVGHTHAMLVGAENSPDVVIVAHNYRFGRDLAKRAGGKVHTSFEAMARGNLRGSRRPLAIDNTALDVLARDSLREIRAGGREIGELGDFLRRHRMLTLYNEEKRERQASEDAY